MEREGTAASNRCDVQRGSDVRRQFRVVEDREFRDRTRHISAAASAALGTLTEVSSIPISTDQICVSFISTLGAKLNK